MNTSGMSFVGWDWLNKEGENFICSNCGYVYWFFDKDQRTAEDIDDAQYEKNSNKDDSGHMQDPRMVQKDQ